MACRSWLQLEHMRHQPQTHQSRQIYTILHLFDRKPPCKMFLDIVLENMPNLLFVTIPISTFIVIMIIIKDKMYTCMEMWHVTKTYDETKKWLKDEGMHEKWTTVPRIKKHPHTHTHTQPPRPVPVIVGPVLVPLYQKRKPTYLLYIIGCNGPKLHLQNFSHGDLPCFQSQCQDDQGSSRKKDFWATSFCQVLRGGEALNDDFARKLWKAIDKTTGTMNVV